MMEEKDNEILLSCSDPTHKLTSASITVNGSFTNVSGDYGINFEKNAASTRINLDLTDSKGKTFTIRLTK